MIKKGGSIIKDLQNIQSELAYTSDDTYLFNYKNKEKDLEKLLYKLSRYEKECKLKKNKNKKLKKGIKKGGGLYLFNNTSDFKYIPVLGSILNENNYIQLYDNDNLISDLIIFQINHVINILELFCILNLIYLLTNNLEITSETLLVTFIVYFCRIMINSFKCKKNVLKLNNEVSNLILLLVIGLPLFILLINNEYYENKYNIIIAFTLTILTIPYFRLLYNKFNPFNKFNIKKGIFINILEKIVCGIIFYIIIINNYDITSILRYIFIETNNNIKTSKNDETIFENVNYNKLNNYVLLNNFKKIFAK